MFLCACIDGAVSFSNPSGILIFGEDSVQRINLTLIDNDTLEVCAAYVC